MHYPPVITVTKGEFQISTDHARLDIPFIHDFLANQSYWSQNIPFATVEQAIANSLPFGVYHGEQQVGFARVITDYTTIAYLGDVFIIPAYRKRGLSKWLIETITQHPNLQGLRRWVLLTADAHGLYAQYGWTPPAKPELYMERVNKNVYAKQK